MTLAERMKAYEEVTDYRLTRRIPVVGRMDGKAFHTLTAGLEKPFDCRFQNCMRSAAIALCKGIQGAKIAFTQSDEITVLLTDYDSLETDAWFHYRIRKMIGEAAAIASIAFNEAWFIGTSPLCDHGQGKAYPARFDARFWNLPKEEVCNCFLWRQRDAEKNSVTGLAQKYFTDAEIHGKDTNTKIAMLLQRGVDWNALEPWQRRGTCIVRETFTVEGLGQAVRSRWIVDEATPRFADDRQYIDRHVFLEERAE